MPGCALPFSWPALRPRASNWSMIMVITVALVLALVLAADLLELVVARRSVGPRRRRLLQ